MAEINPIEELKKIVTDADADTILKLQKIMLDRIAGPTGGIMEGPESTSSCDTNSCAAGGGC